MLKPIHLVGDGIELWFGGADTPVPPEPPETTSTPGFTVAVVGYRPGDRVLVRYVVEGRQNRVELGRPRRARGTEAGAEVTFLHGELTGLRAGAKVKYTIVLERHESRGLITLLSPGEPSSYPYRFVFAGKGSVQGSVAVTKPHTATSESGAAKAAAPSPTAPGSTGQPRVPRDGEEGSGRRSGIQSGTSGRSEAEKAKYSMTKEQLLALQELSRQTPNELRNRRPELYAQVRAQADKQLRVSLAAHFADASKAVREHIAQIDPTAQGDSPREMRQAVLASFQAEDVPEEVAREGLGRVLGSESVGRLDDPLHPDIPLEMQPLFQEHFARARTYLLGDLVGLTEAKTEAILSRGITVETLNDTTLGKLVADGKVADEEAGQLGLAASLYHLTGGNLALTAILRRRNFPRLGDRPVRHLRDLARLKRRDWEQLVRDANLSLPNGMDAATYAAHLRRRVAALYPTEVLLATLTLERPERILTDLERIEPLLGQNQEVLRAASFDTLNAADMNSAKRRSAQVSFDRLRRLANSYPGLQLADVLDSQELDLTSKKEQLTARIGWLERVQQQNPGIELLGLDYTEGSSDRDALNFDGLRDDEQRMVVNTLKAYQRTYAITTDVDDAQAILAGGYHSAMQVARDQPVEFAQATGLEENAARRYHQKARTRASAVTTHAVTAAEVVKGELNYMSVGNVDSGLQDYLRRLTGYEELFGNQAYCRCRHCSSVLSPAAYFVDLMHFVEKNILGKVFTGALSDHDLHVLHLRRRRPDLWTEELTCQNTDQPIPTLEIINEILENYIAQSQWFLFFLFSAGLEYKSDLEAGEELSAGFRQEFESHGITLSDDLAIEPQEGDEWQITDSNLDRTYIVNRQDEALNVYSQGYQGTLKDRAAVEQVVYQQILSQFADSSDQLSVDSFQQPFWLPLERLHVYLEHFDRKLSAIARRLEAPADVVASAALKLSQGEYRLITEPNQGIDFLRAVYGIQFQEQNGLIVDVDDQESLVQELLNSIDLRHDEMDELLQAHFVNPPSLAPRRIYIRTKKRDANSVQNDVERIYNLRRFSLDRIHRFVRLWRRIGWQIGEVDLALESLMAGRSTYQPNGFPTQWLDASALSGLANMLVLVERFQIPVEEALAFWGAVPRRPATPNGRALFDRLFNLQPFERTDGTLPKPTISFVHPAFRQAGAALINPANQEGAVPGTRQPFTALPDTASEPRVTPGNDTVNRLTAGLRISDEDLALLITNLAGPLGANLSAANEDDRGFLLTAANLALLYSHARLVERLRLPIADCFQLLDHARHAGIIPAGHISTLTDLMNVLGFYDWQQASAYSLDDLSVIISGRVLQPAEYPRAQDIARDILDRVQADNALVFADTVMAYLPGVTEDDSRRIVAANRGVLEELPDGRYRLVPNFDPATQLTIPDGVSVPATDARKELLNCHPSRIIPNRLAGRLDLPVAKVETLLAMLGANLTDPALAAAVRGTGRSGDLAILSPLVAEVLWYFEAPSVAGEILDGVAADNALVFPDNILTSLPGVNAADSRQILAANSTMLEALPDGNYQLSTSFDPAVQLNIPSGISETEASVTAAAVLNELLNYHPTRIIPNRLADLLNPPLAEIETLLVSASINLSDPALAQALRGADRDNDLATLTNLILMMPPTAEFPQVQDIARDILDGVAADSSLVFADNVLANTLGVTEDESRRILAANASVLEALPDGRYRLSPNFDPAAQPTIPAGIAVQADAVLNELLNFHPSRIIPDRLADRLNLSVAEIRASLTTMGVNLNDPTLMQALRGDGRASDVAALTTLISEVLPLTVLFRQEVFDAATLEFIRTHSDTTHFSINNYAQITVNDCRRVSAYASFTGTARQQRFTPEQPPINPSDVQQVLASFDSTTYYANANADMLARVLRAEVGVVQTLLAHITLPTNALDALHRMTRVMEVARYLGVGGDTLQLMLSNQYADLVRASNAVLGAFRAKYSDEEEWQDKVEPYDDRLRSRQRDALTDYLIHSPNHPEFTSRNDLYHHFLIDVSLEGCARTSRLVAAISSVQLYIHRCLMSLEQDRRNPDDPQHVAVDPALIPTDEWSWRKNYRVWEANRKVFLFPESYVEPELRDNKTPLFEQLESTLLQQEVNEQTVLDAYAAYMNGFEEIARLKIAGSYHDISPSMQTDILHLFGVTPGDPPLYYYRTAENLIASEIVDDRPISWSPWRRIEVQIPVRKVAPVVYQGRLYVFWLQITTTVQSHIKGGDSEFTGYKHLLALNYTSLRLDGTWTAPQKVTMEGIDGVVGDGAVADWLRWTTPAIGRPGLSPRLDPHRRRHPEPLDGYSLGGYQWEQVYPQSLPNRPLYICLGSHLVRTKDFDIPALAYVDFYRKRLYRQDTPSVENPSYSIIPLLYVRPEGALSRQIYNLSRSGYPQEMIYALSSFHLERRQLVERDWDQPWLDGPSQALSAPITAGGTADKISIPIHHPSRLDMLENVLGSPLLRLDRPADLAIVNGALSELFLDTEGDILLLSFFGDYVLRRIGTTLSETIAETLVTGGVDGLLDYFFQLGLAESASPIRVLDLDQVRNDLNAGSFLFSVGLDSYEAGLTQGDGDLTQAFRDQLISHGIQLSHNVTIESLADGEWRITITDEDISQTYTVRSEGETLNIYAGLDFTGPYGVYYREIFFHIPFLIANHLNSQGRFAAAQRWYHYIFNPTAPERMPPDLTAEDREQWRKDRNWRYREFRNRDLPVLRGILIDDGAIAAYERDPFNPHAIARLRISAYQKAIVMKYIDNLLDWGDSLFAQFTTESLVEATMLYVMATDILGERPAQLGDCGEDQVTPRNYATIGPLLDEDSDFLIEVETLYLSANSYPVRQRQEINYQYTLDRTTFLHTPLTTPELGSTATVGQGSAGDRNGNRQRGIFRGYGWNPTRTVTWARRGGPDVSDLEVMPGSQEASVLGHGSPQSEGFTLAQDFSNSLMRASPVFCIPANRDLLRYWDRVENRLNNIRNCRDITGAVRQPALFAPEIDPRLLVRARAAGLSLEDVLNAISGDLPPYRFSYLIERARQFTATVQSFGTALLSALEKKDVEELNRLQTGQRQNLLRLTTRTREWELEAAKEGVQLVERQEAAARYRKEYYQGLIDGSLSDWERVQQVSRHLTSGLQLVAGILNTYGAIAYLVPQVGSPFAMKYGGKEVGDSGTTWSEVLSSSAAITEAIAASAGLEASFQRRQQEWDYQRDLADHELKQLEKQCITAKIRQDIAERSLELHEQEVEQVEEVFDFYADKFSSMELYTWLSTTLQRIYRDAYNNAFAMARLAEQAFRFERGEESGFFLGANYWEAGRAGLLAGEQLLLDLQNMERRYIETNYRNQEINQSFSLTQIAPGALIALRENGRCEFTVGELFFDLFYPGQYRRRIKAVRLTIPCITGPYINVSARLRLLESWLRYEPTFDEGLRPIPPRRSVTIATSNAQNDAGVFELNFRDERYMPFEGAGAISRWQLSLPRSFRQFDYQTISDVIIHISYTAEEEENDAFRDQVEDPQNVVEGTLLHTLRNNDLARVFNLRHEFPNAFHRLLHSPANTPIRLEISDNHFPIFLQRQNLHVTRAMLVLEVAEGQTVNNVAFTINGTPVAGFEREPALGNLFAVDLGNLFDSGIVDNHDFAVTSAGDLAPAPPANHPSVFDTDKLRNIVLYVEYNLAQMGS